MITYMALYLKPSVSTSIYNSKGEVVGEIELPNVFRLPVRTDLIRRVFLSEFTMRLQPKGRDPMAGKRTTAESLGIGYGLARVPRIKGSTRAAFIGSARGGMATFPPRVEKVLWERVNKKEKLLATASALSATAEIELVRARGHRFSASKVPIVIESLVLNSISKTRDAVDLLKKLGVYEDVERAAERTRWRAGRGKTRGRRYKEPRSVLFIVDDHRAPFSRAVAGLPGVDVATPNFVNVLLLAPGGHPGRLTVITDSSLAQLKKRFEVLGL
ncbi:MAG: 50S ribosomal protein L4 [Acidilobaceae archaeon]